MDKDEGSDEAPDSAEQFDEVPSWTRLRGGDVCQQEWMESWVRSRAGKLADF